ncbi:MAG: ferredoxin [Nanoarchaeota archaeon]|nr:ferredoxin [Nanoarchaeota archaeon]
MKYRIVYNKKECIGAAECEALSPDFWKIASNGKADLKSAVQNPKTGNFELEIDEAQFKKQQSVAGSCPSGCIKVEKVQ